MSVSRPIGFEPNHGQVAPTVKYVARAPGYSLFLAGGEATVVTYPQLPNGARPEVTTLRDAARQNSVAARVLRMRLVRARPGSTFEARDPSTSRVNYFIGNDPTKWLSGIPAYGKVIEHNVLPGIDLAWYGAQSLIECDFVVAPYANPNAIAVSFDGARKLRVDTDGNLLVGDSPNQFKLLRPTIYQQIGGKRRMVEGRYVVTPGASRKVRFEVARYERSRPLIIDPALALGYSTYLGGSGQPDFYTAERAYGIAVDAGGNTYVTGYTMSPNFPTVNAYQNALNTNGQGVNGESVDFMAFVSKFAPSGGLVYSTYLGGQNVDQGYGVAVDSSGDAYVTGETFSANFPTMNAFQATNGDGTQRAFVTKLAPGGNALIYSTYLGGSSGGATVLGGTDGRAIAIDSSGSAYITGGTYNTAFPLKTPYQLTNKGVQNAFVTKLSAAGNQLVYSTFFGGEANDRANGIAVDSAGSAYVAGQTTSTTFPTTPGAYQTALKGFSNAFAAKLSADGRSLVYSTYLGGSGSADYHGDYAYGVAIDAGGSAYLTGQTWSGDFPLMNPIQSTLKSAFGTAFVTKLNSSGNALIYSTFLGGSGSSSALALGDSGKAIAVDSAGGAYVVGQTLSTDLPVVNALQPTLNSTYGNAFVSRLSGDGASLVYSTFLGGSGNNGSSGANSSFDLIGDSANAIALDSGGNAYVAGSTSSIDFPVVQAFQGSLPGAGYENAFVSELIYSGPTPTPTPSATPTATPTATRTPTPTPTPTPGPPIALRASTTATADGATTLTFNVPAGVQHNDFMVAEVAASDSSATRITLTTPTGWLLLHSGTSTAGDKIHSIYGKLASTIEPASYSWTASTAVASAGGIVAYYNVNLSRQLDVAAGRMTTTSTTITAPSLITRHNSDQLLVFMATFSGETPASWTLPAGMTNEWVVEDGGALIDGALVDQPLGLAGATGTRTATVPIAAVADVEEVTLVDAGN